MGKKLTPAEAAHCERDGLPSPAGAFNAAGAGASLGQKQVLLQKAA